MSIIHILNVADYAFMSAGVGVALLMILVGANDRRQEGQDAADSEPPPCRGADSRG